jgi:hypothetical protein
MFANNKLDNYLRNANMVFGVCSAGIVTQPSLSAGCMLTISAFIFSRHTACERNGTYKVQASAGAELSKLAATAS